MQCFLPFRFVQTAPSKAARRLKPVKSSDSMMRERLSMSLNPTPEMEIQGSSTEEKKEREEQERKEKEEKEKADEPNFDEDGEHDLGSDMENLSIAKSGSENEDAAPEMSSEAMSSEQSQVRTLESSKFELGQEISLPFAMTVRTMPTGADMVGWSSKSKSGIFYPF